MVEKVGGSAMWIGGFGNPERVNWRKKETVSLLLKDVREMEVYLKGITQKKGDGNG